LISAPNASTDAHIHVLVLHTGWLKKYEIRRFLNLKFDRDLLKVNGILVLRCGISVPKFMKIAVALFKKSKRAKRTNELA